VLPFHAQFWEQKSLSTKKQIRGRCMVATALNRSAGAWRSYPVTNINQSGDQTMNIKLDLLENIHPGDAISIAVSLSELMIELSMRQDGNDSLNLGPGGQFGLYNLLRIQTDILNQAVEPIEEKKAKPLQVVK
jgi:hypothetical protein